MTIKEFEIQLALGTLTYDTKCKLADNKGTSKKILTILSTDESWIVRYCVASNPNTPVEVLEQLATNKDSDVRYSAQANLKGQNITL